MNFTELNVTTNFSFLRGASHPEEMVEQAATYGYKSIAITDRNSFAGIVRAHVAAQKNNTRLIPACRLDLLDGPSLLAYPTDRNAYALLCNLLSTGNLRAEKGHCHLYKADVYRYSKDIKFIVIPPAVLNMEFDLDKEFKLALAEYKEALGKQLYIAATRYYLGDDSKYLFRLNELSKQLQVPLVATNDVHYHQPARRELQDIITCIREKCTINNAGYRLHPNAERHLKTNDEMLRLFRQYPNAIKTTGEIAEACMFSLNELKYEYPEEITTEGRTPQQELEYLVIAGAQEQFGEDVPEKTIAAIKHELAFIEQMNYASYFSI
jgi:error-prone DNA polymerase